MKSRPVAVAFDVIGTIFSLETLRDRLKSAGLPGETLETWFAQTLRDAFALEVTEVYRPFRTGFVARGRTYPPTMAQPDVTAETLSDVVAELIKLG